METPHHGRWFEDLPVGLVVPHALTRTITETDNVLFTTMTLNPARLHLDAEYAAGTEFGRPLVNSLFTLGLLVGHLGARDHARHHRRQPRLRGGRVPRADVRGRHPARRVGGGRERASRSRAPTQGIVTFEHRGFNQRDELVCRARRNALDAQAARPDASNPRDRRASRSLLFAPASKPDVLRKLPRSRPRRRSRSTSRTRCRADGKAAARAHARDVGAELAAEHPGIAVYVRVNPVPTEWFADDVARRRRTRRSPA